MTSLSLVLDVSRGPDAPEPAGGHDDQPVAQPLALLHRVGGQHDGAAAHAHVTAKQTPHLQGCQGSKIKGKKGNTLAKEVLDFRLFFVKA